MQNVYKIESGLKNRSELMWQVIGILYCISGGPDHSFPVGFPSATTTQPPWESSTQFYPTEWPSDDGGGKPSPHTCYTDLDAIAVIRGEVFAFKGIVSLFLPMFESWLASFTID